MSERGDGWKKVNGDRGNKKNEDEKESCALQSTHVSSLMTIVLNITTQVISLHRQYEQLYFFHAYQCHEYMRWGSTAAGNWTHSQFYY